MIVSGVNALTSNLLQFLSRIEDAPFFYKVTDICQNINISKTWIFQCGGNQYLQSDLML